ncbi:MAG: hypothetical protein FJW20_18515 [Acidimicrobiia bacterium]|nr:hypothetical protein [Acidimicrobiia bacterium]
MLNLVTTRFTKVIATMGMALLIGAATTPQFDAPNPPPDPWEVANYDAPNPPPDPWEVAGFDAPNPPPDPWEGFDAPNPPPDPWEAV